MKIRAPVVAFAQVMEKMLRKNDYKGGWESCSIPYLAHKLREESDEILTVLYRYGAQETGRKAARIRNECADVANIAMMIADNFGELRGDREWTQ